MGREVIWAPRAVALLEDAASHIEIDSPSAARQLVESAIEAADSLAELSELGSGRKSKVRYFRLPGLVVGFASVAHANDINRTSRIIDRVDDPILTDANAPQLASA